MDNEPNKIDKITKGKLDIQLEESRIFEIQSLTDSLDRILASLKLAVLKVGTREEELAAEKVESQEKNKPARRKARNIKKNMDKHIK